MARKPAPDTTQQDDFHPLDALLDRYPNVGDRVRALAKGGEVPIEAAATLIGEVVARALMDGVTVPAEAWELLSDAHHKAGWHSAWSKTAAILSRLQDGETVPVDELCAAYDAAVFTLQTCDDPETDMPASKRDLYRSWWALVASHLGRALTPECERFGIDPSPLLTAGIDPSLSNAIAANAVVERLRLRMKQAGAADRIAASAAALNHWQGAHDRGMDRVGETVDDSKVAPSDDAWMTHTDIAKRHGVDAEALRKRLDRYRARNHNGWREVDGARPNEPKYLYHYGTVEPIAEKLKASGETSGKRPAR
jgi:hypothetical protein